ncbi:MAG TPA: TatD family hydrolase [Bacteroidota bacterium]
MVIVTMYVDSHAHLFREDFGDDVDDVIARAFDAGVDRIVVPGTNLQTSREAVDLAQRYGGIYACVGIHPHEASHFGTEALKEIDSMLGLANVVGVGEIGLDYHYDFSPREKQLAAFREQLGIACERNMPVVVHTRDSLGETLAIVNEFAGHNPLWRRGADPEMVNPSPARGVFHCFTGSAADADRLQAAGFLVSYPGIVTFKKSPVVETLKHIGHKRILLETDSPYMAPVPLRGGKNEPANIVHIGRKVSEILEVPESEVARATSHNANVLFRFDQVKIN